MTNFIPIFPLDIVVYPGEPLNLHIFEPRYKQMVQDCLKDKKPFGILPVVQGKLEEYGTLMDIATVDKTYDNGEFDLKTLGSSVFRVLEIVRTIPDKMYHGAIVNYPANRMEYGDSKIAQIILDEVKRLYVLLNAAEKFPHHKTTMISYEVAHFVGFTRQQEYDLLCLMSEVERLEYIRRHLSDMVPTLRELEEMKARIQRNGHFRDLSLDIDLPGL